jgi:hypothetical protein
MIDPVVEVSRYYSAHDLLDDDGDVAGPFDAHRTRLEEHKLRDLSDGDLLAIYVAVSNDIGVRSIGQAGCWLAAEIRHRGLIPDGRQAEPAVFRRIQLKQSLMMCR